MDILSAARRYRMFAPPMNVVAAVSGGPDSVAMLHALYTASPELGISLHIAHLNHGIRGKESDADEEFVRELAREYGLGCTVGRADVPAVRKAVKLGEEEAAREMRYEFLRKTSAELATARIAIGHTADDRAETVMMNILRGTGIDGLAAMRPIARDIVRPLIETWRTDVEQYVRAHGLSYRTDATNLDTVYSRNRVRHELLPLLERNFNPQVKAALVRLARVAELVSDTLRELAPQAARRARLKGSYDAELLSEMPPGLVYELIRSELESLRGDLKDVTLEQIERVIDALLARDDFAITLPSGRTHAVRKGNRFGITPIERSARPTPFEYVLTVPGLTRIPEAETVIEADIVDALRPRMVTDDEALLDAEAISGHLSIRSVLPGDRIVPFGMTRHKKLQDVFVDRKIPRAARARAVVVADDRDILWVAGVIRSEKARVTDSTRRGIRLRVR